MEALECATLHPALAIDIAETKGSLDFGKEADFVILDDCLNVLSTFIGGKKVWEKDPQP